MDFSQLTLFNVMKTKLNYMSERQSVLAQNVANADTPGYRARDIVAPDFATMTRKASNPAARDLGMARTNDNHMTPQLFGSRFTVEKRPMTDELNPNGNNVVIEEEIMKVGQNQAEYQKVLNLYAKAISMFKVAIGRPGAGG